MSSKVDGSQTDMFPRRVVGWPDPKHGLERTILNDACDVETYTCLICGCELQTVREVHHRACDECNSRR